MIMQAPYGCRTADYNVWQQPDGRFSPCCVYKGTDYLGSHTDMASFHASPEMQKLRSDLDAGIRRPGCDRCWQREDLGAWSQRIQSNNSWPSGLPVALRSIEMTTGRVCTLKCRTCSAWCSTAWESEDRARGIIDDSLTNTLAPIDAAVFQDVESIKVTGGEPFLSKDFANTLQSLAASGKSADIGLDIFTNCSAFPGRDFTDSLRQFKHVTLNFSIDGVGQRNDYIRSGSIWSETVDTMREWGRFIASYQQSRFTVRIAHTISTFNVLYFEEMVMFEKQAMTWQGLHSLCITSWLADGKSLFDTRFLPLSIREQLSNLYISNLKGDYLDPFRRAVAAKLLIDDPAGSQSIPDWLATQHLLDQLRNQHMQSALPELVGMLTGYQR